MNATPDDGNSPHAFLIFLELTPPARHLEKLNAEIKALGNWWHCVTGLWIVRTTHSAKAIRERLRPRMDADDRLLVLETSGECTWSGFSREAAAWLKDHLLPRGASPRARMPQEAAGSQAANGADGHSAAVREDTARIDEAAAAAGL